MPVKLKLNEDEQYGLSSRDKNRAEEYLKKYHLKSVIRPPESLKLYELYMIGYTFSEIHSQYPDYELDRIILTAAICEWPKDRDNMLFTLRDKIQAKVMKSLVDQVEFLTTMVTVANIEHLEQMRRYIINPTPQNEPSIKINSIKDYKDTIDILGKITTSTPHTAAGENNTPLYGNIKKTKAFPTKKPKINLKAKLSMNDIHKLLAKEAEEAREEGEVPSDSALIDINSLVSDD
jgi:hypothetical protein